MTTISSEKILIAESDPEVIDVIARQTLIPLGYQVILAADGASAIRQAVRLQPDVLIANLNLPGLSGKDLIVALTSQGIKMPMIIMAEKGQETNVIQAFRLGASDYLPLPVREAEVLSIVERVLEKGRENRAREKLGQQLKEINAELESRLRDLNTIFAVGKAVISITDQRDLLNKIVEAVTIVTEADLGWLSLKDEISNTFVLAAQRKLPESAFQVGQPVDDGLSALVAVAGETLAVHGQPLQKFKISTLGSSALVVPVKVKKESIGLLTLIRKSERPFGSHEQTLAEAIAGYTAISLVNARLFRALAQSSEAARQLDARKNDQIEALRSEIHAGLASALDPLDAILADRLDGLPAHQKKGLEFTKNAINNLIARLHQPDDKANP